MEAPFICFDRIHFTLENNFHIEKEKDFQKLFPLLFSSFSILFTGTIWLSGKHPLQISEFLLFPNQLLYQNSIHKHKDDSILNPHEEQKIYEAFKQYRFIGIEP